MGPHADGLSRLDGLVVSDGIGAQCWFNCFRCCGAAVQSKRLTTWQVTVSVAASLAALLATAVHTAAYLAVTGIIAWVVYSKFGLAILRKAWLNLNLVWAAALVVTSVVTLRM
jgi:hypothetical protein